jgi:hypothetical protein
MKYLKKFNEEVEKSIEEWCEELRLLRYTINKDDSVDVDGFVHISIPNLRKIPIQFGKVYDGFMCFDNSLETLEGCPKEVSGSFYCDNNRLSTLKGCTKVIGWNFNCSKNILESLEGGPEKVRFQYSCHNNNLKSLEGYPKKIGGDFECHHNPIYEVYKIFGRLDKYLDSLDYKYLRGTNIVRGRFKKACEDAEIKMPDSIPGYKYI